ncbi:MAG: hypothetical protein K0R61_3123 [Microvirga sp.]|jgi:hypothetical protein|nr:hypothetical protein [Microvirga sp.]
MTVTIFDRSGKPVRISVAGQQDHARAKRQVCRELDRLARAEGRGLRLAAKPG